MARQGPADGGSRTQTGLCRSQKSLFVAVCICKTRIMAGVGAVGTWGSFLSVTYPEATTWVSLKSVARAISETQMRDPLQVNLFPNQLLSQNIQHT